MTQERAEEVLAEKGWVLVCDGIRLWRVCAEDTGLTIARGSTWRMAVSEALGIPAF